MFARQIRGLLTLLQWPLGIQAEAAEEAAVAAVAEEAVQAAVAEVAIQYSVCSNHFQWESNKFFPLL